MTIAVGGRVSGNIYLTAQYTVSSPNKATEMSSDSVK